VKGGSIISIHSSASRERGQGKGGASLVTSQKREKEVQMST
jgi:hypothetical protein